MELCVSQHALAWLPALVTLHCCGVLGSLLPANQTSLCWSLCALTRRMQAAEAARGGRPGATRPTLPRQPLRQQLLQVQLRRASAAADTSPASRQRLTSSPNKAASWFRDTRVPSRHVQQRQAPAAAAGMANIRAEVQQQQKHRQQSQAGGWAGRLPAGRWQQQQQTGMLSRSVQQLLPRLLRARSV